LPDYAPQPSRRQFIGGVAAIGGAALLGGTAMTLPASAATTTAFGSSTPSAARAAQLEAWAGVPLDARRTYFDSPPGKWIDRCGTHGTAVVSWKYGTPSQVQAFLASAPAGMTVYGCYYHEPEDNVAAGHLSYAEFLNQWAAYAPAIRAAGAIPTLILMQWTLSPWSGRDWRKYYDPASIDCLGWDVYSWGRKGRYRDPAMMTKRIREASAETGKPWLIAETAAPVIPGTTAGDRAAWAAAYRAELDGSAQAVCWWDQGNFVIDEPSVKRWMGN
jgi:hypothetical protein